MRWQKIRVVVTSIPSLGRLVTVLIIKDSMILFSRPVRAGWVVFLGRTSFYFDTFGKR